MKNKEFSTGADAIKEITGAGHVVKGFNTTGFENMKNPVYKGKGVDMFTAGTARKEKKLWRSCPKIWGLKTATILAEMTSLNSSSNLRWHGLISPLCRVREGIWPLKF